MSAYEPLEQHLRRQSGGEHPMSFGEIERVLGRRLPPSARNHRPWWSNNENSNVATRAWRRAGWKTARVDMASERVVFVRDGAGQPATVLASSTGPENAAETLTIPFATLPRPVLAELQREARNRNVALAEAAASLLREAVVERKLRLIDELRREAGQGGPDGVDLIREDRDGR